jgi:GT2 family glycosyltransferase
MFVTNESLVTRARNMLAHVFLESDCTHLLFVDADVAFDANAVPAMVEADKPIIGALYAKKIIDWAAVQRAVLRGASPQDLSRIASPAYVQGVVTRPDEPVEVRSVGTGAMLIRRDVFEEMASGTTKSKIGSSLVGSITPDTEVYQFFESGMDEETGEFLSEDYFFCQKWRKAGGKVYCAPWVGTVHIGTHHFG